MLPRAFSNDWEKKGMNQFEPLSKISLHPAQKLDAI
jgi:hypothetical protein